MCPVRQAICCCAGNLILSIVSYGTVTVLMFQGVNVLTPFTLGAYRHASCPLGGKVMTRQLHNRLGAPAYNEAEKLVRDDYQFAYCLF